MARGKKPEDPVDEYEGGGPAPQAADPGVIEFDPDATNAVDDLQVQAAEVGAGSIVPTPELLRARDALLAELGGFDTVARAAAEGTDAGELGIENIQAVGIGLRSRAGNYTGEVVLKVFVQEKAPESRIAAGFAIRAAVGGVETDVEEIGEIRAFSYARRYPRPVPCGVSCGHPDITAGTLGCLVVLNNNRLCILSNNHVLANENEAAIGDPIIQPGRVDGGRMPNDRIGVLERFVRINFPGPNLVDAAAAWTAFSLVSPKHITYSMNPMPIAPSLSLPVIKNGRTTQATQGIITGVAVNNVRVQYDSGVGVFNNQIIIRGIGSQPFSQGGDSGSIIVSAGTKQPVGLLFAGSASHTIANTIADVRSQLGISRFVGG